MYELNITHNLTTMANAAGLYLALWRPDEIEVTTAEQLIPILRSGLKQLIDVPDRFKALNPPNGWGDYDGFVRVVREYLAACEANPDATVSACR
ncbi:MAG: hypothetical protein RLZZ373_853 [Pseudomonadota bacterium]